MFLLAFAIWGCGETVGEKKSGPASQKTSSSKIEPGNIDPTMRRKSPRLSERSPLTAYIPKGGTWDSVIYYYLDDAVEKKYELWAHFGNTVLNPYVIMVKDPEDTFKTISIVKQEPKTNKIFRKINFLSEDNPFIKEGFKLLKREDNYLYFELPEGKKSKKDALNKYLPNYLFHKIPQILNEGQFVSNNWFASFQNGYTVTSHTFEVVGINREWIRGEYVTSRHLVYDPQGKLVLDYFGDCEDVNLEMDPTGNYALIKKNYTVHNKFDRSNIKSCIEIYDIKKHKVVFKDMQQGGEWNKFIWNEFGLTVIGCYSPKLSDPSYKEIKSVIINPFLKELYIIGPLDRGVTFKINNDHYLIIDPTKPLDSTKMFFSDITQKTKLK